MKRCSLPPFWIAMALAFVPLASAQALDPSLQPPAGVEPRPSGLITMVLAQGAGLLHPVVENRVQVQFIGRRLDGTVLMDSRSQPRVPIMELSRAVPGWREGLLLMVEGEERRLWIPPNLGASKENEIVVFDVELLRILGPSPFEGELMEIPDHAATTESGARTLLIRPGTGAVQPGAGSAFLVNYTGWTADGNIFDSSTHRGRATAFMLHQVMTAFGECLQQMVVGEKRRCWIAGDIAKGNWVNSPKGDLVFDVELVQIMDAKEVMGQVQSGSQ